MKRKGEPERTRRVLCAVVAAIVCCAAPVGCYTRVVDAKGLGADSPDLRESAEEDAQTPVRRAIRRSLSEDAGR
ncbi:MAG: hypothetical protein AAGB48_04230 [Planctomycetota bacterium]